MTRHSETRILPYSAMQLFDLVADIERYPEFLPWCRAARIRSRTESPAGTVILADLVIGFKLVRERFTSRVTLAPYRRIDVAYEDGPFRYLDNVWQFEDVEGGCRLNFDIDFEFCNRMFQKLMEILFHEAVRRMVTAFEVRAQHLYGKPEG